MSSVGSSVSLVLLLLVVVVAVLVPTSCVAQDVDMRIDGSSGWMIEKKNKYNDDQGVLTQWVQACSDACANAGQSVFDSPCAKNCDSQLNLASNALKAQYIDPGRKWQQPLLQQSVTKAPSVNAPPPPPPPAPKPAQPAPAPPPAPTAADVAAANAAKSDAAVSADFNKYKSGGVLEAGSHCQGSCGFSTLDPDCLKKCKAAYLSALAVLNAAGSSVDQQRTALATARHQMAVATAVSACTYECGVSQQGSGCLSGCTVDAMELQVKHDEDKADARAHFTQAMYDQCLDACAKNPPITPEILKECAGDKDPHTCPMEICQYPCNEKQRLAGGPVWSVDWDMAVVGGDIYHNMRGTSYFPTSTDPPAAPVVEYNAVEEDESHNNFFLEHQAQAGKFNTQTPPRHAKPATPNQPSTPIAVAVSGAPARVTLASPASVVMHTIPVSELAGGASVLPPLHNGRTVLDVSQPLRLFRSKRLARLNPLLIKLREAKIAAVKGGKVIPPQHTLTHAPPTNAKEPGAYLVEVNEGKATAGAGALQPVAPTVSAPVIHYLTRSELASVGIPFPLPPTQSALAHPPSSASRPKLYRSKYLRSLNTGVQQRRAARLAARAQKAAARAAAMQPATNTALPRASAKPAGPSPGPALKATLTPAAAAVRKMQQKAK